MLPSQSHSHLVNGLINLLKGPLPARAGVQPLLCSSASLSSLSSATVRRMPFPRGREIHGLLPCSKGEAATSHHETGQGQSSPSQGGKAAEASPCPCWAGSSSPEQAEPQGAEPEPMPALELHCVGRQLPTDGTNTSLLQPAAPNHRREPPRLVSAWAYFANSKDVGEPGGKAIAIGVLHVNHSK